MMRRMTMNRQRTWLLLFGVLMGFYVLWNLSSLLSIIIPGGRRGNDEVKRLERAIDLLNDKNTKLEKDLEGAKKLIKNLQSSNITTVVPPRISVYNQQPVQVPPEHEKVAVVVLCYNRPDYLKKAVDTILEYIPTDYPLFISQDGDDPKIKALIQEHYSLRAYHIQRNPRTWRSPPPTKDQNQLPYFHIAHHFYFALNTTFHYFKYDAVILIEEDIAIAPDFFSYFQAASKLLDQDHTLWAASAWNDNGKEIHVKDPKMVRRTNFFPGLGWMMKRRVWDDLSPVWPLGYWDDWMRENRKDRDCIYPEISRSYTFGEKGASQGQFFADHLKNIKLNNVPVNFSSLDLSYLTKEKWPDYFNKEIQATNPQVWSTAEVDKQRNKNITLFYKGEQQFQTYARHFEIMEDFKSGVPRTAYRGVIKFGWKNGNTVWLVPADYDPKKYA